MLAQPEPLPERLVSTALDAIVDNALSGWGSAAHTFNETARKHYRWRCGAYGLMTCAAARLREATSLRRNCREKQTPSCARFSPSPNDSSPEPFQFAWDQRLS